MARTARMSLATVCLCAAALLSLVGPAPAAAGTPEAGFAETVVVSGLLQPTAIALLPDGGVLITEKQGRVLVARRGVARSALTMGVCTANSTGLLGALADPGFGANRHVFLFRTRLIGCGSPDTRVNDVLRMTLNGNDQLDPATEATILGSIPAGLGEHNGGTLRAGPDGKLYVSTGDTGLGDGPGPPGNSTNPYAQDLGSLAGKILRLNPAGGASPDNPFTGTPGARPEIYARGFRNPFRFGFDPVGGRLWAGDLGQETLEELDVVAAGGDYGWPQCEGTLPAGCSPGSIRPVFAYPHSGPDSLGSAVTGGSFAPPNFGPYGGQYFFGDYVSGNIYRVPLNGARDGFAARPVLFLNGADGPVDIQFGPDGGLYYVAIARGSVRRVGVATGVATLTDRTPPRHRLRVRGRQRLSRLDLRDTVNEPARLTATGTVISSRASKSRSFRLRKVVRSAVANRRVRIRLRLRRSAAVSAARLVRRGARTRVRIRVSARDAAGNVSVVRRTVRITRP